jgi:hypothetical protein
MYEETIQFSFPEIVQEIKTKGFSWASFQEIFPCGFLKITEGQYIQLLNAVLDALPDDRQRALLLDLVDTQWCVFIEQKWIAREFYSDPNLFLGVKHFALARLQLGSSMRAERNLGHKDGRRAMMSLNPDETLFDRIASENQKSEINNATKKQLPT